MIGRLAGFLLINLVRIISGIIIRRTSSDYLQGRAVFFANHTSHLDAMAILAALPGSLRHKVHPVAGLDYWQKNALRRFIAKNVLHCVLIDRRHAGAGSFRLMAELLQQGDSLLIFPEGTRREDNNIGEFRSGMALLSDLVPGQRFIPVYLEGLSRTLPKGEYLAAPNMSKLFFGAPLLRREDESRDDFILRCRKALQDLSGEVK